MKTELSDWNRVLRCAQDDNKNCAQDDSNTLGMTLRK
jgi:hypothetical protein